MPPLSAASPVASSRAAPVSTVVLVGLKETALPAAVVEIDRPRAVSFWTLSTPSFTSTSPV